MSDAEVNLYDEVKALKTRYADSFDGWLEPYLRSLLATLENHRGDTPSCELFAAMFEEAFTTTPVDYDETWANLVGVPEDDSFDCVLETLRFLVADLRRIEAQVAHAHHRSSPGIQSPSGQMWHHFDPFSYLDVGVSGVVDFSGSVKCDDWTLLKGIFIIGTGYE